MSSVRPLRLRQLIVDVGRVIDFEFLQATKAPNMRDCGVSRLLERDEGDVAEVVDPHRICKQARHPGFPAPNEAPVPELPVVFDLTADPLNRRDGFALDSCACGRPSRPNRRSAARQRSARER